MAKVKIVVESITDEWTASGGWSSSDGYSVGGWSTDGWLMVC